MLNISARDLAPWQPDIDLRKSDKPQIISGRNFADLIDGPVSAFSSALVNYNFWDLATRGKVNGLVIADDVIYGTQTGLWKINKTTGLAELLLAITNTNAFWPWTAALVGGVYYFAQYNIGLWQYDPDAETLRKITTPVGDDVSYVNASYGRLIYLGPGIVGISNLDDGTDLTPSLATAAQAQTLGIVGGEGVRIESLDDGFLVFTTVGIIKANYVQTAYVFQFVALKTDVKLFTPNAGVFIPKLGVVTLDNTGFNLTQSYTYTEQGRPQPWEIEKSDYIKRNIINAMNQNLYGVILLYYSISLQMLFVCFSSNTQEGMFTSTFNYSIPSKRWGSFDVPHTGIFETYDATNNILTCSYMSVDGYMRAFSNTDFSEEPPATPEGIIDYLYRPEQTDEEVRIVDSGSGDVEVGFTSINGSDAIPTAYANYTLSGLFYINSTPYSDTMNDDADDPAMDVTVTPIQGGTYINMDVSGGIEFYAIPYQLPQIGLDSNIVIGPFRFSDQQQADETSAVSTIMLGMVNASGFIVTEDWNTSTLPNEDWNALTGSEDWGANSTPPNVFDLVLSDTNDGFNTIFTGDETLPIFQDLGSSKLFKPLGYSAIWHNLTIYADDPGDAYALKIVDLTGMLTGLLQNS